MRILRIGAALTAAYVAAAAHGQLPMPRAEACDCIVLLGTRGGPVVDPKRSEPAALLVIGGVPYQIDAGEGAARQIVAAGYTLPGIRSIFITHHHLDHTAGLEPLMALDWINRGLSGSKAPPVDIYGPPATEFLVGAALNYLSVSERIFRAGIPDLPASGALFRGHDMQAGLIFSDARVRVTAVSNSHFGHPSTGPDGKRDMSFSYRFDTAAGSVVFTGDTGPSEAVARLAAGADVLVSEVYVPRAAPNAAAAPAPQGLAAHMSQEHLTPADVGKLAAAARVKRVVLTHVAASDSPDLERQIELGVREFFNGPVTVGRDLMKISLTAPADAAGKR